jgi:hypothetical protein
VLTTPRALVDIPLFRTLKANENKIFFDGMEELYKLIQGADKELGGELCYVYV